MPGTPPKVIILSEQLRGQAFELTADQYTIGRTEDRDICIPDPTVSSLHATLVRESEGDYVLHDNGSTNGTRVNGVRIEKEPRPLVHSDILQVGAVEMFYDDEESQRSSGPTTQTVINLEDSQTGVPVSEMQNFSPFGGKKSSESKTTMIVLGTVIGILVCAVLIAVGVLVWKLIG
jgi:pSer/pThr/pTyr-binding forkhead associated (FHA) protein